MRAGIIANPAWKLLDFPRFQSVVDRSNGGNSVRVTSVILRDRPNRSLFPLGTLVVNFGHCANTGFALAEMAVAHSWLLIEFGERLRYSTAFACFYGRHARPT